MPKKLTPMQKAVLEIMRGKNSTRDGEWFCACDLQCSIATLRSLYRNGYLEIDSQPNAMFSPRVRIMFRLKRKEE